MEPAANNEPGQTDPFGRALPGRSTPSISAAIPNGRTVALGRGLGWIGEAWRMFKEAPGSWVACFVIFMIVMIVLALIPVLGNIAGALISPILIAGMMAGCRSIERNDEMEISHLFAGFKQKAGPLFVLGLLELAISLVAMLIAAAIIFLTVGTMFLGVLVGQAPDAGVALDPKFWMGAAVLVLVIVALFIPVMMAVWFAPALVMLDDVEPWTALKWSFFACLKNVGAFLVYGVVMLVLAILATLPLFLGWLLLGPVTIASVYTAYRDIFFAERATPGPRVSK